MLRSYPSIQFNVCKNNDDIADHPSYWNRASSHINEDGYGNNREACSGPGDSFGARFRQILLVWSASISSPSHPFCSVSGINHAFLCLLYDHFPKFRFFSSISCSIYVVLQNAFQITYFLWIWVSGRHSHSTSLNCILIFYHRDRHECVLLMHEYAVLVRAEILFPQ